MDFEEEMIAKVLLRASELRYKISNCIHRSAAATQTGDGENRSSIAPQNGAEEEEEDADEEYLLNICEAFESLESQLSTLQALQQQQQFEREAAIGEIEYSRKILLRKLQEYKGEHLDVIQEASAFASMKVEHDGAQLLLPPYPSHTPHSLMLDNGQLTRISHAHKTSQNGHTENLKESESTQSPKGSHGVWKGIRLLVSSAAKTVLTLVGVVSILSLAGYEPKLTKKDPKFKALVHLQLPDSGHRRLTQCPPGKIAVVEDGEIRCLVKERVQIPFDSVAMKADVDYGCG